MSIPPRHPRRGATPTTPTGIHTGHSHSRCHAQELKGCSRKISKEHYISRDVLSAIGGPLEVSGFPWLAGETAGLSVDALTSKILCERHNNALGPLDKEAGKFFRAVREIDAELADDAPPAPSHKYVINGPDIQRWLLKCLFGLVHARGSTSHTIHNEARYLQVLFGTATWPPMCGLYFGPKPAHAFNGLSISNYEAAGILLAALFNVSGLRLWLMLGRPGGRFRLTRGAYPQDNEDEELIAPRPAGARFTHADRPGVKTLAFAWPREPGAAYFDFRRSHPYEGEPIDYY
jgi:hypothetical protein